MKYSIFGTLCVLHHLCCMLSYTMETIVINVVHIQWTSCDISYSDCEVSQNCQDMYEQGYMCSEIYQT